MTQRKYRHVRGKSPKSRRTVTITPETWDILAVVGGGNHSGGIELLARYWVAHVNDLTQTKVVREQAVVVSTTPGALSGQISQEEKKWDGSDN